MRQDHADIMISLFAIDNQGAYRRLMSICIVYGLLLRQVSMEEGKPVCERIGRVSISLKWHDDVPQLLKGLSQREVYLV
jgi:hypothetical protein